MRFVANALVTFWVLEARLRQDLALINIVFFLGGERFGGGARD